MRSARKELGARGRDDEQRYRRRPVDERVHEIEQPIVRPVQILEDENSRALRGEPFQKPSPRGERFASPIAGKAVVADPDQRLQHRP